MTNFFERDKKNPKSNSEISRKALNYVKACFEQNPKRYYPYGPNNFWISFSSL